MNILDGKKLNRIGSICFKVLLFFNKRKLFLKYDTAISDINKKLELVAEVALKSKNKNEHIYRIWNILGFFLMTSLDIKVLSEQILRYESFGKIEFIIKNATVLMYEATNDIEELLGKQFYSTLVYFQISQNIIEEFNFQKKSFSNFKKKYNTLFNDIRNYVGAHRDHEFLKQLEIYNQLELISFINLLNEFDQLINKLSVPINSIMVESSKKFTK